MNMAIDKFVLTVRAGPFCVIYRLPFSRATFPALIHGHNHKTEEHHGF